MENESNHGQNREPGSPDDRSAEEKSGSVEAKEASASTSNKKSMRGFASMTPEKQREIASKGGHAAHAKGTAHEFSPDEARAAGRKGGEAVSRDRAHMAAIGRAGGHNSHRTRRASGTPRAAVAESETTASSDAKKRGEDDDTPTKQERHAPRVTPQNDTHHKAS